MSNLADKVETEGQAPKRVTVAGETVETHTPKDQIALDQHVDANKGVKMAHRGLYFTQLVPPGTG